MSPNQEATGGEVGGAAGDLLRPQAGGLPFAPRTPLTEPFWAGCARGELLFQRCADCRAPGFPPAEACRACLSRAVRWELSTGLGALYSWTVVRRPVSPAFRVPYAPAIVTLDEGYQMMTCLIGLDAADIRPGMRLRAAFHLVDPAGPSTVAVALPYFGPDAPA
ncbi:Zn-ribbon domain-containing OB-fold protein [Frankia nepalensis]|uniref:Zn-ribbon domain-containing OB-fold protein n=1 Tax=Frankia nepalensis TaxID=1836974 RepID=UPI003899127F